MRLQYAPVQAICLLLASLFFSIGVTGRSSVSSAHTLRRGFGGVTRRMQARTRALQPHKTQPISGLLSPNSFTRSPCQLGLPQQQQPRFIFQRRAEEVKEDINTEEPHHADEESSDSTAEGHEGEEQTTLPTQKLFAVIEMAESAQTMPETLANSPDLQKEQEAYLKDLMDKGLIVASGSFESQEALTGVWVVKADSLESALRIRDNSPYWNAGVIPNTIVRQWNAVGELVADGVASQLDEAQQELAQIKEIRASEAAKAETYAAQVAKVQDAYTRVMNDFSAYKKRTDREKEMAMIDGKGAAVRKLLPMIDAFFIAFDTIQPQTPGEEEIDQAYRSLYHQMIQIFESEGLERVGNEGEEFDPTYHQATDLIETEEYPDGVIVKVLRAGFTIGEQLVRPAFVQVSSNPADAAAKAEARKAEEEAKAAAERESRAAEASAETENQKEPE
mmetsp:Transcript_2225/g.3534  ORF Transcript_2225/g.3534 Transcript_2225/m.3534 type:complete len:448 (-) Transcript_2225:194-1537(-)